MKRIRTVMWPFAAAGLCLLGLSLLAPLAWRNELPPTLHDHPAIPHHQMSANRLARWSVQAGRLAPWWRSEAGRRAAVGHIPGATPVSPYPIEIPPPLPEFVEAEAGTILLGDEYEGLIWSDLPEDHHLELAHAALAGQRAAGHDLAPRVVPSLPSPAWLAQIHPVVSAQHNAPDPVAPQNGPTTPTSPRVARLILPTTLSGPLDWPRVDPAETTGVWPVPQTLIEQLEGVDGNPLGPDWARQVAVSLVALQRAPSRAAGESADALEKLRDLSDRVARLTMRPDTTGELLMHFTALRRVAYAVARRVDIWRHIHKAEAAQASTATGKGLGLAGQADSALGGAAPDAQGPAPIVEQPATMPPLGRGPMLGRGLPTTPGLRELLSDLEPLLGQGEIERRWKSHLRWEELVLLAAGESTADAALRGQVARRVLVRLEQSKLGAAQLAFLQRSPFVALEKQLHTWVAAEPVDYAAVLANLERYEQDPTVAGARIVADDCDRLRWHAAQDAEVGRMIEAHYRNANLRVAVSGELINRLVPSVDPVREAVDDQILGARVQGDSVTWTRLFVRLLPDHRRVRLGLEARGTVQSDTESSKGPARIFSQGSSEYSVRKTVIADRHGVRSAGSEANARSHNETTDVATDYDSVPILNQFIRKYVRSQADEMAPQAARETEWRVAERARQRMDSIVQAKLAETERNFNRTITTPLVKLGLEPTPVEMQTTEQRITSRVRLAAHEQLGAHTPRMQAPADSLISVQLHESAINNAFARLALEGQEYKLEELMQKLFAAAGQKAPPLTEEMPEGVTIRFADAEAVRFRFDQGEAAVTIRIAKLVHDGRTWKDFQVRGRFRPVEKPGIEAAMAREGTIELVGKKLSFSSQIQLRTIFTKVFSNKNQLRLVPDQIARDPRLKGLQVNQFELSDGWLSVAIGPAGGMRIVRQPRTTVLR